VIRLAVAADDAATDLAAAIRAYVGEQTAVPVELVEVDLPPSDPLDAPEIAVAVAEAVRDGRLDRGILLCGSGVGMAIAANKVPGIRAAQCHDPFTAEHARTSNDAQILVLGARATSPEDALRVVAAWLAADFEENPRRREKMAKLRAIEARFLR
jgi:ribose 5-phosphate isomerase B